MVKRKVEDPQADEVVREVTRYLPGIQRMSDVEREEINWLWYPYIPAGRITMLEGDPGLGKSWICCDIAARVSTGTPFPGQNTTRPPQRAIMLSAEDGLGDTIRPRLEALGADISQIFASDEHFTLDGPGIKALEATLTRFSAAIVFLDPVVGYMGGKIDMHKANEVRGLMAALHQAAKKSGAALVAVRHLRKAQGGKAIYSGIGSIDFTAAARSVIQVQETKAGLPYISHAKHNLSPEGTALGYKIENGTFEWTGGVDWKAEDKPKVNTKFRVSVPDFLFDLLKDGPQPYSYVLTAAKAAGVSQSRLTKEKTGVAHSRKIGKEWYWELDAREGMGDGPPDPATPDPEHDRLLQQALARIGRGNG